MNKKIEALCVAYGIQTHYEDIWGARHVVNEATQRSLLRAMGVRGANDRELGASLIEFNNAQWRATLPPVVVAHDDDETLEFDVTVPAAQADAPRRWRLRLESGEVRNGVLSPSSGIADKSVTVDGVARRRFRVAIPQRLPLGYHDLEWVEGAQTYSMRVIIAPRRCYVPDSLSGNRRVWGFSAQLYGVRTQHNWGMGDFTDLRALVEFAGGEGAGIVAVNPLHALFSDNPAHDSPYSPSHRALLNGLYIDVEAVPDYAECAPARAVVEETEFQAQLRALRANELVDYVNVAAAKHRALELLYAHFREHHLRDDDARGQAFRTFQRAHVAHLRVHAIFETLQEYFHAADSAVWGWPAWPAEYQDPNSPAVAAFAAAHGARVEYFEYLQWQADEQLGAVGKRSWELGLGIGVLQDLALAPSGGGAEVWANRSVYTLDAELGAPPDDINLQGQNWGLAAPNPHALRACAYQPFIAMLRANMHHAGALRIDHVMALARLFWIPKGEGAATGAYVNYPRDELLAIVALESRRNWCLVIGEDLGTVPADFRAALQAHAVLSYRVLFFEKAADGYFSAPQDIPQAALMCVSTHDLPTLAGFWRGHDLDVRQRLGLLPDDAQRQTLAINRAQDRARLLVALEREQLLPSGGSLHPVSMPEMSVAIAAAVHAYAARSPAALMLVQCEDVFGNVESANLPGTINTQHPNWQRKLPLNLREWPNHAAVTSLVAAMRAERGSSVTPHLMPAPAQFALPQLRVPRATYRLQLNNTFTFRDATALIPYLQQLGISHLYCSPYLKARAGSTHGYDIVDHAALNPEIGSTEDFERLCAALRDKGMGQILDMVPNHMGVMGADNLWWLDVLENGPAAEHAAYFDIDWNPLKLDVKGKVLIPVLGAQYGVVLERGELKLRFNRERGEFSVYYYQHRFPIDPQQYPAILALGMERLVARLGAAHSDVLEFQSRVAAFRNLPPRDARTPEHIAERQRDKELHKQHLAALCARSPDVTHYLEENITAINGDPQNPISFGALHDLIQTQAFRLAYWRVAADEINYRRFFDINDLAAIRMENAEVFDATHGLVLELLRTGKIDGLRIDHPDGLYKPAQYFQRLQSAMVDTTRSAASSDAARNFYLVVEKILAPFERLPETWPVHGTTGYEFANNCLGLFIDVAQVDAMTCAYEKFIGDATPFDELLYNSKRLIMNAALAGELNVLAQQLSRIAEADRATCDFTLNGLRGALLQVVANFPVYRTYIDDDAPSSDDVRYIDWAIGAARKRSHLADLSIFDFVRDVLLKERAEGKPDAYRQAVSAFAMRFQQYTSPIMAKSMEDTSFYIYNRLGALNEVGGDPRRYGISVAAFHHSNQERARFWPHAMLSTSTHDSKRSEDVRARLAALSELTDEWGKALQRWSRINRAKKIDCEGAPAPSANDEYLLYQTLLGAWPWRPLDAATSATFCARIEHYMLKAVREAKVNSSWLNPNTAYEDALTQFVRALLDLERGKLFMADLAALQRRVAQLGVFNALSQLVLKLTVPGMPDIYQGNELWDLSLVDPDNRRPVDYSHHRQLLESLHDANPQLLLREPADGRIKLWVTSHLLQLRVEREALLRDGDYLALTVTGTRAEHLCAFARRLGETMIIVVVPRMFARLLPDETSTSIGSEMWGDTMVQLPNEAPTRWRNRFTGISYDSLSASALLGEFPWAVLEPEQ